MQRVTDQIEAAFLQQTPPRAVPYVVMLNLFGDYLFDRPLRTLLDPVLILSAGILVALLASGTAALLWVVALAIVLGRLGIHTYRMWSRVWDDISLLKRGLVVRAHILKLRPYRTLTGEIDGVFLDCAIPVAPRRTYVGSLWVSDGNEALRLSRQGQIEVVCLPRTPGTWRVIEDVRAEVRYDRIGTIPQIPHDIT